MSLHVAFHPVHRESAQQRTRSTTYWMYVYLTISLKNIRSFLGLVEYYIGSWLILWPCIASSGVISVWAGGESHLAWVRINFVPCNIQHYRSWWTACDSNFHTYCLQLPMRRPPQAIIEIMPLFASMNHAWHWGQPQECKSLHVYYVTTSTCILTHFDLDKICAVMWCIALQIRSSVSPQVSSERCLFASLAPAEKKYS